MQTDAEYAAYKARAFFFNATSRTADGFVVLIFRRAPFVRLPDVKTGVGLALQRFENDVDLSATNLGWACIRAGGRHNWGRTGGI